MTRAAAVLFPGALACALAACAQHREAKTVEPAGGPVAATGEATPRSGWVYSRGDGKHPGLFLAVGTVDGKLTPMVVMTPPGDPADAANGVQIPLKDVESSDRRVSFRMQPVMEMIKPFHMIIEFDAPPAGERVQGYFVRDPADASMVGLSAEQLAGWRAPAEFRRMPWPIVPTWEERKRAEEGLTPRRPAQVNGVWSGG